MMFGLFGKKNGGTKPEEISTPEKEEVIKTPIFISDVISMVKKPEIAKAISEIPGAVMEDVRGGFQVVLYVDKPLQSFRGEEGKKEDVAIRAEKIRKLQRIIREFVGDGIDSSGREELTA